MKLSYISIVKNNLTNITIRKHDTTALFLIFMIFIA
jgi:hypothetical protein